MSDAGFALVAADALVSISKWTVNKAISFGNRSRIFLLGAAGEQEENGLGASASGPARTLTQNVPLGSRVVSQKVNFLGQGNKGGLISSAVRRRTGEYPPARLLLPGGLEPRSPPESRMYGDGSLSISNLGAEPSTIHSATQSRRFSATKLKLVSTKSQSSSSLRP